MLLKRWFAPLPPTAHASAYAILAFADGGSRNSSLHPPQEELGISTLAQGSREVRARRLKEHRGAAVSLPSQLHRPIKNAPSAAGTPILYYVVYF